LSITIVASALSVTTKSLPSGTIGAPLASQLTAAGGTPPYTKWAITNGAAAPGLTLSPSGLLSGTPTSAGAFSFTVQVTDSTGASASASLTQTINQAPTTTTLTSSPNPAAFGQTILLTATVLFSAGASPGSGSVMFQDASTLGTTLGTTTLGTVPLSGGVASISPTTLAVGSHSLTAVYLGDANNAGSTSSVVTEQVNLAATSTTLTVSANPSNYGQAVTLTAAVVPAPPDGIVTFYDGANVLGTNSLAGRPNGLTTSLLPSGTRQLRVYFGGGTNYKASTSAVEAQTVVAVPGFGFQSPQNYATGNKPVSIALGDFNGDGKPDLAVVNSLDNNVSVLLGNGDGTFQAGVTYGVGSLPVSVAVGDFNQDGKADLAVGNQGGNSISVLLGNGDGTFQQPVNYAAGSGPSAIAAGDFNGDGKIDLALTNSNGNVIVLIGNGDGAFQTAVSYAAGRGPVSIAVGDFNADGKPDLALANNGDNNVSVLLGNGDGTFQGAVNYAAGSSPSSIALADFNGDGVSDLVVANNADNNVGVLLGNGDGTFQPIMTFSVGGSPNAIALGDFNGDGKPDLAIACNGDNSGDNSLGVLLGNGDGTFQPVQTYSAGVGPVFLVVADFNGDSAADIAAANPSGLSILLGATNVPAIRTTSPPSTR
jgi:hypothetical protein